MRNRHLLAFAILTLFALIAAADTKIKTRNTMMGHSTESMVYIKGARQRSEQSMMGMGPTLVTVTQCDQKRIITINSQANTCMVMPLGEEAGSGATAAPAAATGAGRRGGVITFNISSVDTGERQKMLGLTARHIKMTMSAQSSPDACSKTGLNTESDGWYADIAPQLSCSMGGMPPQARPGGPSGCQDTVRFKRTGGAYPGYPLKQTTTMQVEGQRFTTTSEVVELTNAPLDASLFEMPAGCRVVSSYQELMGMGGMAADMMAGRMARPTPPPPPPPTGEAEPTPAPPPPVAAPAPSIAAKHSGVVRVGVVKIKDASGEFLPIDNLRMNLMSEVTLQKMEAVALDSDGEPAIAAEASHKGCDYILHTEVTQVKAPGTAVVLPAALKGVTLDSNKYQAVLAMTLYKTGKPLPRIKQEPLAADDEQLGVNAVLAVFPVEAQRTAEQVKKDQEPPKPAKVTAPAKKAPLRRKPQP